MTTPTPQTISQAVAPGRRERRKQALRQHIYDVAAALFISQGFEATTVEQIADAADVAPATFFNHFHNKHAVLVEMTNEVITHVQALLDRELTEGRTTRERLIGFGDAAAADIEQSREIARNVVLTMIMHSDPSQDDGPAYLVRVYEPFAAMLRDGQNRGEVRNDLDADFLAEMVIGIVNATITSWLARDDYPIEKRLRQAAQFAWESIQNTSINRASAPKADADRR